MKRILSAVRRLVGDPRVSSRFRHALRVSTPGRFVPDRQAVSHGFTEHTIDDDWFRAHFIYAPDVIAHWLRQSIPSRQNASVLDFGCGDGIMALGMRLRHDLPNVCGVDLHESNRYLAGTAAKQIGLKALPPGLEFMVLDGAKPLVQATGRKFDFIYSWSVFEHIPVDMLPAILRDLREALDENGRFFLQIEPLYYSPFGSHLGGVISEPWAHLLLPENELAAKVLGFDIADLDGEFKNKTFDECSSDDFKTYLLREYRSLNKITLQQLMESCSAAGFEIVDSWSQETHFNPPTELLSRYSERDLRTTEIRLLLK